MSEPDPTRRPVSNPLALAVLALLFERPMHPYEMAATLRTRGKEKSIKLNYGSLYTVVDALVRAGFIVARETLRESARPERTVYALTDDGRVELRRWLSLLLSTPQKEYPQFEAALSLMPVLPPAEAQARLEERLVRLEDLAEQARADLREAHAIGLDWLFLVEDDYALAILEAERAWLVRLLEQLRQPERLRLWKAAHQQLAATGSLAPGWSPPDEELPKTPPPPRTHVSKREPGPRPRAGKGDGESKSQSKTEKRRRRT